MDLQILNRTNNVFELVTVEPVLKTRSNESLEERIIMSDESDPAPHDRKLRLKGRFLIRRITFYFSFSPSLTLSFTRSLHMKFVLIALNYFSGQMIYMDNWRMLMYLGTPVMPNLDSLIVTGLYINDLSMHDFSR